MVKMPSLSIYKVCSIWVSVHCFLSDGAVQFTHITHSIVDLDSSSTFMSIGASPRSVHIQRFIVLTLSKTCKWCSSFSFLLVFADHNKVSASVFCFPISIVQKSRIVKEIQPTELA